MAAPVQRYSDPRLYGVTFTKPLNKSYEWIRAVANPLHPKCSLIEECAVRAIKVLTGILAIAITSLPALVGRIAQVIHYHSISEDVRLHPPEVIIDGMHLPSLQACPMPRSEKYHGTNEDAAISILRWGFDPNRTAPETKIANAVYVSADYGLGQLILTLDLREGEFAYVNDAALRKFTGSTGKNLADKKVMAAVRELFYQNGYRAIKYDLKFYGTEEAWAVYDPSCISIQQIRLSQYAVPETTYKLLAHA